MLFQPYKSDFILAIIKWVEANGARNYWTLIKNSEVNNKYKNKYWKINHILPTLSFKVKIFPDRRLRKHKFRLWIHEGIQQQGVNYWENYDPVVNWIS